MATGLLNLALGRVPSYTRKWRHLELVRRYGKASKLLNLLRVESSRLRGDLVVQGLPYVYTVDTGNVCNLRCPLCPTGYHGLQRPQANMTLGNFSTILEKIRPYAIEIILHNWGEPFLNPDILDIVRAARAAEIGTTLSSNLNLVHRGDDFLRDVVDSGLDHLTVSLDGTTQDIYQMYRRGGEIDQVFHNLRVLLECRNKRGSSTPAVEWQFLVMKHNQHQMEEARRLAREFGVDRLRFTSAGLPFDQVGNQELAQSWLSDQPRYRLYHPEKIHRQGYLFDEACFYLYRAMTINPQGEVSPCCVVYHSKHDFGNLLTTELKTIWNNDHYRSSRALFSRRRNGASVETVCSRCPLFKFEANHSS